MVNTGWIGGAYGVGSRIKLKYTRAIIHAIHSGALENVETTKDERFGFEIPTSCPEVPSELLIPSNTWVDKDAYEAQAKHLAGLFVDNFKKFEEGSSEAIIAAGPKV